MEAHGTSVPIDPRARRTRIQQPGDATTDPDSAPPPPLPPRSTPPSHPATTQPIPIAIACEAVVLPGSIHDPGMGVPLAPTARVILSTDLRGPHINNAKYYERLTEQHDDCRSGDLLKLKTVCLMQVSGKLDAVPAGRYRVMWRIKPAGLRWSGTFNSGPVDISRGQTLGADGKAVKGAQPYPQFPAGYSQLARDQCSLTMVGGSAVHDGGNGPGWHAPLEPGTWTRLVTGTIELAQTSDVVLKLAGGNGYWTPAMLFDYAALEPLGLAYEVVMLLLLASYFSESSPLAILDADVIRCIVHIASE